MGELERYGLLALLAVSVLAVGFLLEELRALGGPEQVFELKASQRDGAASLVPVAGGLADERAETPGGGESRPGRFRDGRGDFDFFEPPVTLPGTAPVDAPPPGDVSVGKQVQVRSGDTLEEIARRELGSGSRWKEILALNDGIEPSRLKLHSWLVLPALESSQAAPRVDGEARIYVVAQGDSFEKIARRFYSDGSEWMKIFEANRDVCRVPERLRAGTRIVIP